MEERVFVLLPTRPSQPSAFNTKMISHSPPLNLHDPVKELNHLIHPALRDKGINPADRFISQEQPQLMDLAGVNYLWLLNLSEVVDKVFRICCGIRMDWCV